MRRGIARLVQGLREREVFGLHPREAVGIDGALRRRRIRDELLFQIYAQFMARRHRDSRPRRINASENAAASWRTQGTRRISLRELHAAGGERINVRRFVIGAAEAVRVVSTEVIGEDEEDVWLRRRRRIRGLRRGQRHQ